MEDNMGNYKELQKYLENTGKTEIKLSFDNLKNILNIEVRPCLKNSKG
jgi:DNA-binding ferritin-like protein (Dps family)